MANLSNMTVDELRELLDEYGVKHGPIVDTTRSLYERKLREAMTKAKKPGSDKTYYREEEEEVTYLSRTPVRGGPSGDSTAYMRSRPEWPEREYEHEASFSSYAKSPPEYTRGRDYTNEPYTYSTPTSYRSSYLKSTPVASAEVETPSSAPKPSSSSGLVPAWVQVIFFLMALVFMYLVFSSMESNEPIKGIE